MKLEKSIVFAAIAVAAVCAHGAPGTWNVREGVGTGGTNWAVWEDPDNWSGGVIPSGYDGHTVFPSTAVYVNATNDVSVQTLTSSASSRAAYSVIRGDSTIGITYKSGAATTRNALISQMWLYSNWTWECNDGYQWPGPAEICGDCTSFSGNLMFSSTTRFRFDLYSNTAGETRTYAKVLKTYSDIRGNGGSTICFVAPRGSDDDIVGTWCQTNGSPFLSRVGEEHVLCVGTAVTGDGIPDGTFLKRVFPDGTIELSAAATNTVAANSLTFAAFTPNFSAGLGRIYPYNSIGVVTIRAQKYRAKDKARITAYVQPSNAKFAAQGLVISTESGFVPATLALSSNAGHATKFELQNCEIEFTGSGKADTKDFHYCTFSIPGSAHTARLLVGAGKSSSIGIFTNRVGKIVKGGAGRLSIGLPYNARSNCTGSIEVEEGTLEIRGSASGDNYVPSLMVRSGATVFAPDGLVCGDIVVEAGGVLGGVSQISCATMTAAPGAIVDGCIFDCDAATDEQLAALTYRNGGGYAAKNPSGAAFGFELLSGDVLTYSEGDDAIFVIPSNAEFRVTGNGSVDMLLVGGGGGGGYKAGGGGGGGGVVYTQGLAIAEGVWSVVVGAGGHGATNGTEYSTNGGDTRGFGLCAFGGGAGGTTGQQLTSSYAGKPLSGASGGGGGTWYPGTVGSTKGAAGIDGQGFGGGTSTNASSHWWCAGGGGGGAGAAGADAYVATGPEVYSSTTRLYGGGGGDGRLCEIFGSRYYGGGGGGGTTKYAMSGTFLGGQGGGGDGGKSTSGSPYIANGKAGKPFTGGGGGGGSGYSPNGGNGGDGGCGIAILRIRKSDFSLPLVDDPGTGGNVRCRHGYAIHTFTESGTLSLQSPVWADILVVGGGGGGGLYSGGGGGAGGVLMFTNVYLFAGDYPVVVGDGGRGANAYSTPSSTWSGKDSSFGAVYSAHFDKLAYGGGGGGTRSRDGASSGASGGGAGAGYPYDGAQVHYGGKSTKGQGHSGGSSTNESKNVSWAYNAGGGGGGAGAAGANGYAVVSSYTVVAGNGGDGVMCDFSGKETWYGGGGGGGSSKDLNYPLGSLYQAKGGKGGGGRGAARHSSIDQRGEDGKPNTGGGGGGGASVVGGSGDGVSFGGAGGSGIVIIRYHVRPRGTTIIVQ